MSKKKSKNQKASKTATRSVPWLPTAMFIAAGLLLFYPPYFRGLFFAKEMFITHIITALVFIGVWSQKIINRDYTFLKTPLDLAVLAYTGAYLLSLLGAVDKGEALYGFLKVLNYSMIFWIISEIVKTYRDYDNILKILLASATGVALIGILAAWGYYNYPDAFNGRAINTTMQYSNAAGLYLGVMALIAISQWISSQELKWRLLYAGITYLLLLVTLATFSKGAWLIIIIGAILLLVVMPGQYRIRAAYSLALSAVAVLIAAAGFIPAILNGNTGTAIVFFLIGLVLSLLAPILWEVMAKLSSGKKKQLPILIGTIILVVVIGSTSLFLNNQNQISNQILNEISGVSATDSTSFTSRLNFASWGMDIIKDHPVIGTGAGGWDALYHQYADQIAWSAELHNGFLQIWVEAGTLGIIAFMSIWVLFLFSLYKIYQVNKGRVRNEQNEMVKIWGTAVAAVCIGLHSFIDFDLSLPAISILLWTLLALINSAGQVENITQNKLVPNIPFINITAASLIALLLLACGSSFALADSYASKGQGALERMQEAENQSKQLEELSGAEKYYKQAVIWDSYNCMYHANLAQIYAIIYRQVQADNTDVSREYLNKAYDEMNKVDQTAPFNIRARGILYSISAQMGDVDQGIKQAQAAVTANPWDINSYNAAINALQVGIEAYCDKDIAKTQQYAQEILSLTEKAGKQRERLESKEKNEFNLSYDSQVAAGKAHYVSGNYQAAAYTLEPMTDNMLTLEFADPFFENTKFENENWKAAVVEDEEASNDKCMEMTAKHDMYDWPTILSLGSSIPVIAGQEYITEVRYKVIICSNSPEGEKGPKLGIWGKVYSGEQSENTSFTFYNGNEDIQDGTIWQVAQQVLKHGEGLNQRSFRLGTGSVAEGTTFRIDYVKFYPSDLKNLPDNIQKASIWYAASLYQSGEKEEANEIKDQFADDTALMELYDQLLIMIVGGFYVLLD